MRIAFFSPMPPSRSGIADYSATLLDHLRPLAEVEVFSGPERTFDPRCFDALVYQLGNNPFHAHAYETALRHPGVVVLHEANLHHLIADITIRRGDWDAYMREVEHDGGEVALAYARRVRALEVGPDYEGVPMLRRVLEAATGVIVHSRFMLEGVRSAGYAGPAAVIPHGAWIPDGDRNGYRSRLGIDESAPLVGVFGFLKPYKRIAESLRAFRRLTRVEPAAKMILAGETHPDFPVGSMIWSQGLGAEARLLGFTSPDDFTGFLSACDIVLNLRYPTVGESSGTLLRALGLGKAVLVSDVGAFSELPDDICLKVPPGPGEEDLIFEYLSLLASRPEWRREIGAKARDYVARECSWVSAARRYVAFLSGEREQSGPVPSPAPVEAAPEETRPISQDYLMSWASDPAAQGYVGSHLTRLRKTLEITPPGVPEDRVLEMGAYMQITPALASKLGYGEVRGCYYGPAGTTERKQVVSAEGERFECFLDLFDAEKDRFPYPDGHFSTVLCCELIEHLYFDPMHLMAEANRILRPGGSLVLTTPNIASLRAVSAILKGYHPGFFHAYLRPRAGGATDARHNREYAPREIHRLLQSAGFEVARLETGPFLEEPGPELAWVERLLERYELPAILRGEGIYAVGRKTGPVAERYPDWLYS